MARLVKVNRKEGHKYKMVSRMASLNAQLINPDFSWQLDA